MVRRRPESEQQAAHAVLFGMKFSFLNGGFQCLLKCPELPMASIWGCRNKETLILVEHKGDEACDTLELPGFGHCQHTVWSQHCHSHPHCWKGSSFSCHTAALAAGRATQAPETGTLEDTASVAGAHEVLDVRSDCPSWVGRVCFCWVYNLFDWITRPFQPLNI